MGFTKSVQKIPNFLVSILFNALPSEGNTYVAVASVTWQVKIYVILILDSVNSELFHINIKGWYMRELLCDKK